MQYIAFDSHTHYAQACVEDTAARLIREARITHERGAMREFLTHCEPGSSVAVETVGNWYWIVDEIEASLVTRRPWRWMRRASRQGRSAPSS